MRCLTSHIRARDPINLPPASPPCIVLHTLVNNFLHREIFQEKNSRKREDFLVRKSKKKKNRKISKIDPFEEWHVSIVRGREGLFFSRNPRRPERYKWSLDESLIHRSTLRFTIDSVSSRDSREPIRESPDRNVRRRIDRRALTANQLKSPFYQTKGKGRKGARRRHTGGFSRGSMKEAWQLAFQTRSSGFELNRMLRGNINMERVYTGWFA